MVDTRRFSQLRPAQTHEQGIVAVKRKGSVLLAVSVIALSAAAWVVLRPGPLAWVGGKRVAIADFEGKPTGVPADFKGTDAVARGKYLTVAADCEACHTAENGKAFAGGRPFDTDFGTLYSPNITPDAQTGIGKWSDADFLKAMHEGIGKGGKKLYPAFPYAAYTYLTDEDVLAIKAYLFSLPPQRSVAPENTLHWPYNNRWLMSIWSKLYNPNKRFEPVADRTAEWNRGAYLAEALEHCGDCHTPRTALQALNNRRKFAGGTAEGWRAYNLTPDKASGIGTWNSDDLETYLRTGHSMNKGSAFGPMAQAVHLSFQKLLASDVRAIAQYVQSVPAVSTPDLPAPKLVPASEHPEDQTLAESDARGRDMFASMCAGCHSWTGVNDYVPHSTLTGTRAVNDPSATNVALAVLRGASTLPPSGDIVKMPAFGVALSDDQIADVSNYVVARFGAKPSSISGADVEKLRAMR